MTEPAKLTKGQRRRARIAAMTPEEQQEWEKRQAEKKARRKAKKAAKKAPAPVSKATVKAASFTEHEDLDAIKEMNAKALRAHQSKSTLSSGKAQDVIKTAGEIYRSSPQYRHQRELHNLIENNKKLAANEAKTKKKPAPYTFQLVKVGKGKDAAYNTLWNEAVKLKVNPHDFIDQQIHKMRSARETAKLAATYNPEIKPVVIETGRKLRVNSSGVIISDYDEWESK